MSRYKFYTNKQSSINSINSINSNNRNIEKIEKIESSDRVVFFGGYEGSNEQIPYSYYELQNIFNQTTDEEAVRFYHEAKKLGEGELTFLIDTGVADGGQKKLLFED